MNDSSASDKLQSLLNENAQLRAQLEGFEKAAHAAVEYERNWQIAQQDKLRTAYEKEIRELRDSASEARSYHRESMMDFTHRGSMW